MKVSKFFKSLKKNMTEAAFHIKDFVRDPQKDFSRTQKISAMDIIGLVMNLGSKSSTIGTAEFFAGQQANGSRAAGNPIPSDAAVLRRREQVKPEAFESIYHSFTSGLPAEKCLLTGLYTYAVDGSSVRFRTDDSHKETYHAKCNQDEDTGYNDFHLHCIMDEVTGVAAMAMIEGGAEYNEKLAFHSMLDSMERRDGKAKMRESLFIADRGYESFADIIDCQKHGSFFLFKGKATNGIMGRVDSEMDTRVHYHLYYSRSKKAMEDPLYHRLDRQSYEFPMNADGYCDVEFRAVSFRSGGKWTVLLTNLPKERCPPDVLKAVYKMRWDIETGFRKMKYPCDLLGFHSGKPELVLQEIWATLAKFNLSAITAFLASEGLPGNKKINFAKVTALVNEYWKGRLPVKVFWDSVLNAVYYKRKKEQRSYKRTKRRKSYECFNYRAS